MTFDDVLRFGKLDLHGRRVFVRADLDPVLTATGRMSDDTCVRRLVPLLNLLSAAECKVVVAGHATKPDAAVTGSIANALGALLKRPITRLPRDFVSAVPSLRAGQVALAPNLALYPEERSNDAAWAGRIARAVDVYVNEAPSASRHEFATTVALPAAVTARAPGPLFETDLEALRDFVDAVEAPFVAVVGGRDLARKAAFLRGLVTRVDVLMLGGVLANTFLAARGWTPQASAYEPENVHLAAEIDALAAARGVNVLLPEDCVTLTRRGDFETRSLAALAEHEAARDIGPRTRDAYLRALDGARTVLVNGSLGDRQYGDTLGGTRDVLARAADVAPYSGVIGDGSVELAGTLGVRARYRWVSQSGDAALDLVSGIVLPGVESLRQPFAR